MAGVAYDGLQELQSIFPAYITYQYRVWNPEQTWVEQTCYDDLGEPYDCSYWEGGYDNFTDTSNAIVNGTVVASSTVYVNGNPIASTASTTNETWTNSGFKPEFVSATPATNGAGVGLVSDGNGSRVYANGSSVSVDGSTITTCIGNPTTINGGSSNVFVG